MRELKEITRDSVATVGYKGLGGGSKGLQRVIRGYTGLKGVCRGLQGVTRGYRG